ncbi:hypothetical protein PIB30_050704 [Stylosanthes scabra]|uniref:Uncharacterized protein n=1 Tax=Stylosanthes scabra TaxID=79078 RepID=A0ABU6UGJ8_9FABA|nr:hypothetical protein [Stylosanthes scabra]
MYKKTSQLSPFTFWPSFTRPVLVGIIYTIVSVGRASKGRSASGKRSRRVPANSKRDRKESSPAASTAPMTSCARKASTPLSIRVKDRRRANLAPSPPSSLNSAFPRAQGYHPLELSVVTSVASLQCQVITLSDGLATQSTILYEIKEVVLNPSNRSTGKGVSRTSTGRKCCGYPCHCKSKGSNVAKNASAKKRGKDKIGRSTDTDGDPTYQPPLNTNFSTEHMPRRVIRARKKAKVPVVVSLFNPHSTYSRIHM